MDTKLNLGHNLQYCTEIARLAVIVFQNEMPCLAVIVFQKRDALLDLRHIFKVNYSSR